MTKLTVIPDTNLFVQCRPLQELDWRALGAFDDFEIVATKPTQREIDKHKNSGNDRLAQRTRRASTMLRDLLLSDDDVLVVRKADPRVTLVLRPRSLRTLTNVIDGITIVPTQKRSEAGPDYRVLGPNGSDFGAAWNKIAKEGGKPYISKTVALEWHALHSHEW
jgi:hypothetical protein